MHFLRLKKGQNLKNRIQSNPYVFLIMFSEASQNQNCCDIARRNSLSYDPDIWVNNNVIPFHYTPIDIAGSPSSFAAKVMTTKGVSGNSIISILTNKRRWAFPAILTIRPKRPAAASVPLYGRRHPARGRFRHLTGPAVSVISTRTKGPFLTNSSASHSRKSAAISRM